MSPGQHHFVQILSKVIEASWIPAIPSARPWHCCMNQQIKPWVKLESCVSQKLARFPRTLLFRRRINVKYFHRSLSPVSNCDPSNQCSRQTQETTGISTKNIKPSKLEGVLEDISRGAYVVEMRHNTFKFVGGEASVTGRNQELCLVTEGWRTLKTIQAQIRTRLALEAALSIGYHCF